MRAFSEDLDLCWRARIAGHSVRFEPEAKARHAIALATGLPVAPALAQCNISRTGTPDFDQRRLIELPNDGLMYCAPTAVANGQWSSPSVPSRSPTRPRPA